MRDTFKFVKQQDIMDCGVACIQMILKHYDSDMPAHKRTIHTTCVGERRIL